MDLMPWVVLAVGIVMLTYIVLKKMNGATAPQITAMTVFPTLLILCSLFSSRLTTVKAGADGFEFGLSNLKDAAEEIIKENPGLAEDLSNNKQGEEAVKEATERIQSAKSSKDLEKLIPFKIENEGTVFYPAIDGKIQAIRVTPKPKTIALQRTMNLKYLKKDEK